MEKEVSVIVPIHGVGKYLSKCLNSLIEQDFNLPYEIICVSDNCCDNSDEVIEEFKQKYPDIITTISVCNKNPSDTRNDGFKIATGKYIMLVDGDDSVLKSYISSLYNIVIKDDLDIGCANYYNVVEGSEDKLIKEFTSKLCLKKETNIKKASKVFALDVQMRGFVWNKIYKRQFLIDNNILFNKKFLPYDDFNFNFLCFSKTKKNIGFTSYRGYLYLQRKVSYTKGTKQFALMNSIINGVTFVRAYQLIHKNEFPYDEIYFSKKFLLKYNFYSNRKQIENYKEAKRVYLTKFKNIINAKELEELDLEIVEIAKGC